jgi:hypothetical protein
MTPSAQTQIPYDEREQLIIRLQDFQKKLNKDPDPRELDPTPDGKAKTLPISYVEMTLDELYFGLWDTYDYKWSAITNEVQGSMVLEVIHPVTGKPIRRTGAASIVIIVDSLDKQDKDGMTKQERNLYALNPENKKPNALDLGFPKLKAECLKNAAQSLGKVFGRDINRKKIDTYKPTIQAISSEAFDAAVKRVEQGDLSVITLAEQNFIMTDLQKEILRGAAPETKRLN